MQVAWKPAPGQVALIEVAGNDRECLTGVVVDNNGGPVVVDLGSSPHLPGEDCEVVASFFAPDALYRIHGGYGYSKEYEIERLYRDAPLLLVGEGTSEIQKLIVARGLLARYPL